VIVGPGHVDWMAWQNPDPTAPDSAPRTSLDVQYDDVGRTALASWTSQHVGEPMLVLLEGRVVFVGVVQEEISTGALMLTGPNPAAVQRVLEQGVKVTR
jgi:preprotein translocase subunit SecD